jgi:electron transport complex protein RnfD
MKQAIVPIHHAPHIYSQQSQRVMVFWVFAALVPSALWGILVFGPRALLVVLLSMASAAASEGIVNYFQKKLTLDDGSALLTGFVIGLAMPPNAPLAIPVLSAAFAILVVKWSFGGLGSNWMNPAMAGAAFAYVGWPGSLSSWSLPSTVTGVESVTGATPISLFKNQALEAVIHPEAYAITGFDTSLTNSLNEILFHPLGASLPGGYIDLIVGNHPGAIGEVSTILLLLGTVFLLSKKIIRWEIPAAVIASFSLLTWAFGGIQADGSLFQGDILFSLCSGAVIFVAFFSATDPVTSPMSLPGRAIYGCAIGLCFFLFRASGGGGGGAAFAVIIANCFVPLIDSMRPAVSKAKEAAS